MHTIFTKSIVTDARSSDRYGDAVGAQRAQVLFHGGAQFGGLLRCGEGNRCAGHGLGPGLGGQNKLIALGAEGAVHQVVGQSVAVEQGGVQVGHAEVERSPQPAARCGRGRGRGLDHRLHGRCG